MVEYVLLRNPSIPPQRQRIKLAVKIRVNRALHPNVNGKGFVICEAEECYARGNLIANAENFLKLGKSVKVASRGGYHIKISFARGNSLCRANEIFIAESWARGEKLFRLARHIFGFWETIANAAIFAIFVTRGAVYFG